MSVAVEHRLDGPEDAPVLMLSNSLGTTTRMWDPQMPVLTEQFRVLRYDKRGHGDSPAPPGPYTMDDLAGDALALLDSLGIDGPVLWAGVSIGGMTGLWLAINAPDRIERLVGCCTAAYLPPAGVWQERADTVRSEGMQAVTETTLERWFSPQMHEDRPEVIDTFREDLLSCDPEGYAGCCLAIAGHDVRDRLGEIESPTLVIAGGDDPSTPPELGREIADGVPGSRFEVLPGMRHLSNVEAADDVNRLVMEHLTAGARA